MLTWIELMQPLAVFIAIPGALVGLYQLVLYMRRKNGEPGSLQAPERLDLESGISMQRSSLASMTNTAEPNDNTIPVAGPIDVVHLFNPASRELSHLTGRVSPLHDTRSISRASNPYPASHVLVDSSGTASGAALVHVPSALPGPEQAIEPPPHPASRAATSLSLNTGGPPPPVFRPELRGSRSW